MKEKEKKKKKDKEKRKKLSGMEAELKKEPKKKKKKTADTDKKETESVSVKPEKQERKAVPAKPEKQQIEAAPAKVAEQSTGEAENPDREAALIFKALGDDVRLEIVRILENGEVCAAELLKSLSIVQSTLSHHMKILCEAGVVTCRRQGRWSYYSIHAETLEKAEQYMRVLRSRTR